MPHECWPVVDLSYTSPQGVLRRMILTILGRLAKHINLINSEQHIYIYNLFVLHPVLSKLAIKVLVVFQRCSVDSFVIFFSDGMRNLTASMCCLIILNFLGSRL